jgi:hypothetical protein
MSGSATCSLDPPVVSVGEWDVDACQAHASGRAGVTRLCQPGIPPQEGASHHIGTVPAVHHHLDHVVNDHHDNVATADHHDDHWMRTKPLSGPARPGRMGVISNLGGPRRNTRDRGQLS